MPGSTISKNRNLLWFAFGFVVFDVWVTLDLIDVVPWYIYVTAPLAFVLAALLLFVPGIRFRRFETRSDKFIFFAAIFGSLLGALVGIALKYS